MTGEVCPARRPVAGSWSSPAAQLLLRADAPRSEWLRYRARGIGSSDASAVVGVNRWTSAYEVWAEKTGTVPPRDLDDDDAVELGRLLEPIIVDRWSTRTGISVRRAGLMASRARPWQLASVDRLAACGGIVEAKTLSFRVAEEWSEGQTPDHAEVQVQHQMAVTGRGHAHVVGLQDGRTWLERTIARDEDLIADLVKIESEFWHEHVLPRVEPPVDGSEATRRVLTARWPDVVDDVIDLDEAIAVALELRADWAEEQRVADRAVAAIDNELRAKLAEHATGRLPDGREISWRRNGTFSARKFAQAHPEEAACCTVPAETLDLGLVKKTHPDLYAAHRARVLRLPSTREG